MRDLSKRLRGDSFRHAVEAVAALRRLDPGTGAGLVPSTGTKDEQRAFQLLVARLVAEGGVHGLAARWRDLPSPQWREMLVGEKTLSRRQPSKSPRIRRLSQLAHTHSFAIRCTRVHSCTSLARRSRLARTGGLSRSP
jgi:hypothetical protein